MANERTYLAWVRTSIGIMAFGFVVERFALFLKQLRYFLEKTGAADSHLPAPPSGYSSFLGVLLVGLGALMGVLAFIRYKKVEKQIDQDAYQPSITLDILLVISILTIGVFLVFILLHSM
jgi:putative membrane protein